jgi:hypothetical protein
MPQEKEHPVRNPMVRIRGSSGTLKKKLSLANLTFIQASVVIALPLSLLLAAHLQALYLRLERVHLGETHSDQFRWIQMTL